jgi:hypothetical protein
MRRKVVRRPHGRHRRPLEWGRRLSSAIAFLVGFFLVAALPTPLRGACSPGYPGELLCTGGCPEVRTRDQSVFRLVLEDCRLRASDLLEWLPQLAVKERFNLLLTFSKLNPDPACPGIISMGPYFSEF